MKVLKKYHLEETMRHTFDIKFILTFIMMSLLISFILYLCVIFFAYIAIFVLIAGIIGVAYAITKTIIEGEKL